MKTTFIKLFAIMMVTVAASLSASAKDETRAVSGFNAIASSGSFHVYVKIDGTESLKLSGPEETLNQIETVVEHGTLKIKYKTNHYWGDNDKGNVDIYITAKELSALINSGSGNIKVEGTCNASNFKAVLSGSGSITTTIKADEINASISGSGSINVEGTARDASIAVSGSGSLNGKRLETTTSSVAISGSGNVYIAAEKELSAHIVGSGSIRYSGNASVSTSKIGSGSVTKMN